jgi:iron(III) transport system permease protein
MNSRRAGATLLVPPRIHNLSPYFLVAAVGWLVLVPLLVTFAETPLRLVAAVFTRPDLAAAMWRSVWISLASVALAALFGVPLAFLFARAEFPGRAALGRLLALPVALPPLVGALAFLFLYGESGFAARAVQSALGLSSPPWRFQGPWAILWVHAYSMYVYFYLFVRAALSRFDPSLLDAAASLGRGRWAALWRVELPMLGPALWGASLLTFLTSLGSFSAPYLFGGSFRVMTTQITASKLNGEIEQAQAETVALAAVALLGLFLVRRYERRDVAGAGGRGVAAVRGRAGGTALWAIAGWTLAALCLLPHATVLLLAFVPPGTWTNQALPPALSLSNFEALALEPERWRPILNSLWMALAATVLAVVLGLAAALAARRRSFLGGALETLVAVPWAVPGTALALAVATAWSVHEPSQGRLLLVGTAWILPLAYCARGLPLTGRAAIAGLRQVPAVLGEAAASLGAGPARRLARITLPLLRPALLAGASVAFLAAFGDFVVSIVLYTYETRPISIEILSSLRVGDLGVAAAYGVLLTGLSAAAFLRWGEIQ